MPAIFPGHALQGCNYKLKYMQFTTYNDNIAVVALVCFGLPALGEAAQTDECLCGTLSTLYVWYL